MSRRRSTGKSTDRAKASLLWPALLIVLVCLTYLNSLNGPFVYDDQQLIDNPNLRTLWPPWLAMSDTARPLVRLSFAFNHAISGLDTTSYHILNVLFHVLCTVVLYGIIRRTIDSRVQQANPQGVAFACALLWALHPIQTASVTYIVQRYESMMALFYLLTLYCVIRAATGRSRLWAWAAIASCVCGMASKEVMITAPLVVLLYDRTFLSGSFSAALRQRGKTYVGLCLSWLVVGGLWTFNVAPRIAPIAGFSYDGITPLQYALTQPGVLCHYMLLAIWPAPLCMSYGWPIADTVAQVLFPGLIVLALIGMSLWALYKKAALGFVGTTFFVLLIPTSTIMPISVLANETRMYLPLACVVLVLTFGGMALLRHLTKNTSTATQKLMAYSPKLALIPLVVTYAALTHLRNGDYQDPVILWQRTVDARPENVFAHNNLGYVLLQHGQLDAAAQAFRQALSLNPDYDQANNNLAYVLITKGNSREGLRYAERARDLNPLNADAHNNIGLALYNLAQPQQAVTHFKAALEQKPDMVAAQVNWGNALLSLGQFEAAASRYRLAIELDPNSIEARTNLANTYLQTQRVNEAITLLEQALVLNPTDPSTRNLLGNCYLQQKKLERAEDQYRNVLSVAPNHPDAHNNLGITLAQKGQLQDAVQHFQEAIRWRPNFEQAKQNLAWVQSQLTTANGQPAPP